MMTSETVTKRAPVAGRVVLRVLGILIGLTALAAFLQGCGVLRLEAVWPALGQALEPLDEWRQLAALLVVAWAIALQFMLPEKTFSDRLPIRPGLEDADPRAAERPPRKWVLLLSAVFVVVWVGLLELLSRRVLLPGNRVFVLAGAVVVQTGVMFGLLQYAIRRQKALSASHWATEQVQCSHVVRALLNPAVGFLLGVGTLGFWVGLLLAVSGLWPQMIGLPPAGEGHASLLAVMSLAADEALDAVLFGVPALYGLVLGQPLPHSWIGATLLVVFRATVALSLFLVVYHAIKTRRTYASLIRQVVCESSAEAGETLARIGRPVGPQLVRKALRLRAAHGSDPNQSRPRTLLLQAMYSFYHPRTLRFALRDAARAQASDGDRVEALKYVCTYGAGQDALGLMRQFFNSENPALREGVSLICVAFEHPDCNVYLEKIGCFPHTPSEYRNAVIGAGVRLTADLRDGEGLNACLEALPNFLNGADPESARMLEAMPLLASFAATEVKTAIQAAWPTTPSGIKLLCLNTLLKIRAGLLPDPAVLGRVLSNDESDSDRAGIGELWRFMTQAGVASLTEIAKSPDSLARNGALDALSQLRARRPDLEIDAALLANMMAPADEPDADDSEAEPPVAEAEPPEIEAQPPEPEADVPEAQATPTEAPTELVMDPETHLVSL